MTDADFTFPDQELFEPTEPEEGGPSRGNRLRRWLVWLGALAAILGLLYLSGVYQALLLRPTPESFRREPLAQIVSGEELLFPVQMIVLGADAPEAERWSDEAIARLAVNASAILNQAGIGLRITDIERRTVSPELIRGFVGNPVAVADIAAQPDGVVTVALVETLLGLNGIAFVGRDIVAVADYTGSFNDRVLAHEIGHILGLGHVGNPARLMAQGSEGLELTPEEAEAIREAAVAFLSATPSEP